MRLVALEKDRTDTLLGLQFWDRLTDSTIATGLAVTAQRLSPNKKRGIGKIVAGRATPNGVITFFGLVPGEKTAPNAASLSWPVPTTQQQPVWVVVKVTDQQRRFLPMSFQLQLPRQGAPRKEKTELRSMATRVVPPGSAVIRAQIVTGSEDDTKPAAYALVKVRSRNNSASPPFEYYGMADKRGILALLLPYPVVSGLSQPPSLAQQTFPLAAEAFYRQPPAPSAGQSTPDAALDPEPLHVDSKVPDLAELLSQPQVHIVKNGVRSPSMTLDIELEFEVPYVLKSNASPGQDSVLRIEHASP